MSKNSDIEWTESTWNPIVGCSKCSPGCAHCYAVNFVWRTESRTKPRATPQPPVQRHPNGLLDWTGVVRLLPDRLGEPLCWKDPRKIFVNSLSDLFHEDVSLEVIQETFSVMWEAYWHEFQILSRRSQRLVKLSPQIDWPSNAYMGVSVEDSKHVFRIDHLRQCGAKKKFLSLEPLLGPMPQLNLAGIAWVICGGESGKMARPLDLAWIRDIRDQCKAARVPFFLKQLGKCWAQEHGATHKKGGNMNEWPEDLQIREQVSSAGTRSTASRARHGVSSF